MTDMNGHGQIPMNGATDPAYLVTAAGNAAEGIPRGNIRGGRDPLAGGTRTEMQHYPAHVTCSRRTSSSRDQPPAGWIKGAERRSSGWEWLARTGDKLDSDYLCLS
jgi:hypothetical protein